jgi:hypothetical protein
MFEKRNLSEKQVECTTRTLLSERAAQSGVRLSPGRCIVTGGQSTFFTVSEYNKKSTPKTGSSWAWREKKNK